jgi:predicted PurR-regulated permease PerM
MWTAARAAAGVVLVAALAVALWYARTAILLGFAGILLAIVLCGASGALSRLTRLPHLVSLAAAVGLIATFFAAVALTSGPTIAEEITQLATRVARGVATITQEVAHVAEQRDLVQDINLSQLLGQLSPWGIASGASAAALSVVGAISALLIVLFFGIYFAADPNTYLRLVSRLAPEERRDEAVAMLSETGDVLRRWLIGQGISMATIGGVTYLGLLPLGVPIPFALALFAGLCGFLPYLGPIIGAIPMVLVAGGVSLTLAFWVLGLYVVIQLLESYVLTPLIQARAVFLPPAIVILNQLFFGGLFGILGLALATPLAAAASVPLRAFFGPGEEDAETEDRLASLSASAR